MRERARIRAARPFPAPAPFSSIVDTRSGDASATGTHLGDLAHRLRVARECHGANYSLGAGNSAGPTIVRVSRKMQPTGFVWAPYTRPMTREIRPRFEVETDERMDTLLARISARLRSPQCTLCGIVAVDRIELYVPAARQRFWSPELQIDVHTTEHGTLLEGRYAPHPHVWMAYAVLLALSVVSAVAILTFAFAEWSMDRPMTALYALPSVSLVFGVTYCLAFVGQGLATSEMDELRAFLDDAISSGAPRHSGVRHRVPTKPEASVARC